MKYDNMTDKELIREADGKVGLIHALSERLDMRRQPDSVFHDQAFAMRALGEETARDTPEQAAQYLNWIDVRGVDIRAAVRRRNDAETLRALIDCIAECIGYGLSRGWPMELGWQEFMRAGAIGRFPDMALVLADYAEELS